MALSAFDDKTRPPEPGDLERVLGGAAGAWRELVAHVGESFPPVEAQWGFPGAKYGWSLRLRRNDRVVLYMTPQDGRFMVGVVLGEKAVAAARRSGLPGSVMALVDAASRYAEGRGIRFEVAAPGDLDAVRQLAALKMAP
jgi:hypothetical protein